MSSQLSLERLEFKLVHVAANLKATAEPDTHFPQLNFELSDDNQYYRSSLTYDMATAEDPRYFVLLYGIKIQDAEGLIVPYEVEMEAVAFLRYEGDGLSGSERFRAVRMSGYQILHGAIREMLANITARGRHGLMHLPAQNFNLLAKEESERDESSRQEYLQNLPVTRSRSQSKRKKLAIAHSEAGDDRTKDSND